MTLTLDGLGDASRPDPKTPKTPPSDADALRQFVSLATDHASLIEALPVGSSGSMTAPSEAAEKSDHWRRLVRAASIRKFVANKQDSCYLPNIMRVMQRLLVKDVAEKSRELDGAIVQFHEMMQGASFDFLLGDEPAVGDPEILEDLLNGRLLHSDYAKWWRSQSRAGSGFEVFVAMFWLPSAEQFVSAMRRTAVEWVEKGVIQL